jgi:opacity protein-like surface antigen
MPIFLSKSGLALILAVACLGGRTAHAQAGPVAYWLPNWPLGFGGNSTAGQNSNTYGNLPGFDGSDIRGGGFSYTRTNFPNGLFVGSASSPIGLGMSGINQIGAFGNISSLSSEGVQFGYNLQNAPLTVYGGFNTLKYTTGIGSPFAPFDTTSGTLPVYSAHAGIEFRPTSNLSLSLGVGYTQQSGDINSLVLPGASPFVSGRR